MPNRFLIFIGVLSASALPLSAGTFSASVDLAEDLVTPGVTCLGLGVSLQSGPNPVTVSAGAGCEGPTEVGVVSGFAQAGEYFVEIFVDSPVRNLEFELHAAAYASVTFVAFIEGGHGAALVDFLLSGGSSNGFASFRALGQTANGSGDRSIRSRTCRLSTANHS
ncbi:MAG: hypothetical protein R2729_17760 [Bryobacteraceae bacterium]